LEISSKYKNIAKKLALGKTEQQNDVRVTIRDVKYISGGEMLYKYFSFHKF